jgi:hypothetical protein
MNYECFQFEFGGIVLSSLLRRRLAGSRCARVVVCLLLPVWVIFWGMALILNALLMPFLLLLQGILGTFGFTIREQKADGTWKKVDCFAEQFRDGTWRQEPYGLTRRIMRVIANSIVGVLMLAALGLLMIMSLFPHYALLAIGRRGLFLIDGEKILFRPDPQAFEKR